LNQALSYLQKSILLNVQDTFPFVQPPQKAFSIFILLFSVKSLLSRKGKGSVWGNLYPTLSFSLDREGEENPLYIM
jgi:hypothetical protein